MTIPAVHPLVTLLVEERQRLNLSQREVAVRAGRKGADIFNTSIAKIENGVTANPKIESLDAMAAGLGVKIVCRLEPAKRGKK